MRTPVKLGAYVLGLVAVFGATFGVGRLAGPGPAPEPPAAAHGGGHGTGAAAGGHLPGGLQVTEDGYRLVPLSAALSTGAPQPFRFRILGPDGAPLTRYTTSHDKDLHLIVVRRDLSGFRHVHPELAPDGTWSVPLAVREPGQYRVFADFRPAGHAGGLTLGVDVPATGDYRPRPLPPATRTAAVDGYTVTLGGDLTPGAASTLTLTVSRGGVPVTDLQPYLGAYGHLVALRDGDLAYLHVHPEGAPGDGRTPAGPGITFAAEVPSAGTYRLYLDFQHAGTVRTAEFTAVAGPPVAAATGVPAGPPASAPAAHDATPHTHD